MPAAAAAPPDDTEREDAADLAPDATAEVADPGLDPTASLEGDSVETTSSPEEPSSLDVEIDRARRKLRKARRRAKAARELAIDHAAHGRRKKARDAAQLAKLEHARVEKLKGRLRKLSSRD